MIKILNAIKNIGLTSIIAIAVIISAILFGFMVYQTPKQVYAFPGAQGYGAFTTGGRGGVVYHVRTLKDTAELGSLRYAINQNGPRTIVFDVTGDIELNSPLVVNNGNLTIAGQTAPGEGVGIKNHPMIVNADNVIIRFLKFRSGDSSANGTSLTIKNRHNIIIDHCSISWATSNLVMYNNQDVTLQWSIISEALRNGSTSGKGAVLGGYKATYHHNLFASNSISNPEFYNSQNKNKINYEVIDFRNNLLYNWETSNVKGYNGSYNLINNYYRPGAATDIASRSQIIQIDNIAQKDGMTYVNGNYIEAYPLQSNDNWMAVQPNIEYIKTSKNKALTRFEFDHESVLTNSINSTYKKIIEYAGASLQRDDVDKRISQSVETFASMSKNSIGIISNPQEVGGYPKYTLAISKADADGDGIPDDWEYEHSLNPYDAGDGKLLQKNDYTNLEIYLNELVSNVTKNQNSVATPNLDMLKVLVQRTANKLKS